jgi:two-component system LytT family sensor kinase
VSLGERGAGYLVRISDDGVGFDPSREGHITGSAVGLAAMRERAELAGGWVSVESAPGEGTVVEYWLPANRAQEHQVV